MAKDSIGTLFILFIIAFSLAIGNWIIPSTYLQVLLSLSVLLFVFSLYFFRDPNRSVPDDDHQVLAAGDGRVIAIEDVFEDSFLNADAVQVSIFLSVFDVHVNRVPISGMVEFFRYKKGDFLAAYKKDSSIVNEQTIIGIDNGKTKVLFKQIAGIIARRIICNLREGMPTKKGERFELIKFGSRIDMILPKKEITVQVRLKQKVKGGVTVIGVIR